MMKNRWKKNKRNDEEVLSLRIRLTYRDVENLTKLLLSSNQEKIEKIDKMKK